MTMQQQQTGQTTETVAMNPVVSPLLRTDDDAATANPLTDLSILDLKARKERLQQMIRKMELCDQKKAPSFAPPPLSDTVEESTASETAIEEPTSSTEATEDDPTPEKEELVEDEPVQVETAQTKPVEEEEETQVEEASALKKRLQQMIRSMELRDEKKAQHSTPPLPQPDAVEDNSINTQETSVSEEEQAGSECEGQQEAVETETPVEVEPSVDEEETQAEDALALKKRLQLMIQSMELRDQKKAKLEQPSSSSIVEEGEELASTEEYDEPTSSPVQTAGDDDDQESAEKRGDPALVVETAAPGEVAPSEPEQEPEPVAAPVTPESQENATAEQSSAHNVDEAPISPVVTRRPTLTSLKSAFRKNSRSLTGSVSFATKPSSSSSPRKVVFDLSTVSVHQDSEEELPEIPCAQDHFDEDEDEDGHKHDDDDDEQLGQDEHDDQDKYDADLWEEQDIEDDDEDSIWEEEVIEDDDVVQIAPPPKKSFTVSQPTWEDRQRFVKKLYDLRDEFSITEDNTSVTDDSTISDWHSETSYGSPVSQRYEEQLQRQRQQQQSYRTHSPPPPRPLSPPCARRMSMVSPMNQPLSPEKATARAPLERRSSMPVAKTTSFVPKKSKLPKLAPTSTVSSTTGKKLPQPIVVSPQTLPSDTASYQTVSLSFLTEDLKDSVAVKVMEEALRILVPGGILYAFDVEGKAIKMLPDELRDLLVRVPYAGVKQTVHEIQTQEIMRNNGYVDLFPREDLIVRWMAVKPKDMVC